MENMDEQYIRIAELSEQIGKLNTIIELHEQTTADKSMIVQYVVRRDEFVNELQSLFRSLRLTVSLTSAA